MAATEEAVGTQTGAQMCTVVIRVPEEPHGEVRLLAVRDEDPARPWDAPGEWWPAERPRVIGVRDARAGGAWLAVSAERRRLAVILNRADVEGEPPRSRGGLVLDAVAGRALPTDPATHGFNLVEIEGARASVSSWDGREVRRVELAPGTHMVAHDEVDDPATARITRWHAAFQAVADVDRWQGEWLRLLARSAELGPHDDAAIVRDNRVWGYPTQSLLVCTASVDERGASLSFGELAEPGRWDDVVMAQIGVTMSRLAEHRG